MFKHFFYDPFPPPPPLPSFLPFFFFFALSQFRGPDYLGTWNRLFQTLIWRPGETVQNLKSSLPDYPGELTALTVRYNFDLRSHVIAKHGTGSDEIAQ